MLGVGSTTEHEMTMRYLLLGCDPAGDCPLWVEGEGPRNSIPVPLSPAVKADLLHWNERMSEIVRNPDRYSSADLNALRAKLNGEGLGLARRVAEERDAKVRYLPA
jgi:hypothetical protein